LNERRGKGGSGEKLTGQKRAWQREAGRGILRGGHRKTTQEKQSHPERERKYKKKKTQGKNTRPEKTLKFQKKQKRAPHNKDKRRWVAN